MFDIKMLNTSYDLKLWGEICTDKVIKSNCVKQK